MTAADEETQEEREESAAFPDLIDLERRVVEISQVFLDPNNPRFGRTSPVPDSRVDAVTVQEAARAELEKIGISDITRSIRRYGFVPTDPIVVRPFAETKYVTLEGNRRLASIKRLLSAHERGEAIDERVLKSLQSFQVLVYTGHEEDIAWIIQGLRHLAGIKQWEPLQQAAFLAKVEGQLKARSAKAKRGRPPGIPSVGRSVGLTAYRTGLLLRSYYGYMQVKELDDYTDVITSDKFSLFAEAVFRSPELQAWLGWDDEKRRFTNDVNVERFLNIVLPTDAGEARIARAVDVRDVLPPLISHPDLLTRLEEGDVTLSGARAAIEAETASRGRGPFDIDRVLGDLTECANTIDTLPIAVIAKQPNRGDFVKLLLRVKQTVEQDLEWIGASPDDNEKGDGTT